MLMPSDNSEKVLQTVKMKGPLLPIVIAKDFNVDTLIASAMLSELSSRKLIKISSVKVGGSPLYYARGQEYKLQNYYNQLNEKEKMSYDLLKDKKVLDEASLEPVIRVALKQIKDFAIPVIVNNEGLQKVFFKWYLTSQNEADDLIKSILKPSEEKRPEIKVVKEEKPVEEKSLEEKRKIIEEKAKKIEFDKERKKLEELRKKEITQKKLEVEAKEASSLRSETSEDEPRDDFLEKIRKYCAEKGIEILDFRIIKKRSEIDLIVKVPSAVGTLEYYCKAKDKKKISEADLSSAFVQGQVKKLPVLIFATGDLNKKASLMLQNEFKGMNIKRI